LQDWVAVETSEDEADVRVKILPAITIPAGFFRTELVGIPRFALAPLRKSPGA
jgi:hypothetical protein